MKTIKKTLKKLVKTKKQFKQKHLTRIQIYAQKNELIFILVDFIFKYKKTSEILNILQIIHFIFTVFIFDDFHISQLKNSLILNYEKHENLLIKNYSKYQEIRLNENILKLLKTFTKTDDFYQLDFINKNLIFLLKLSEKIQEIPLNLLVKIAIKLIIQDSIKLFNLLNIWICKLLNSYYLFTRKDFTIFIENYKLFVNVLKGFQNMFFNGKILLQIDLPKVKIPNDCVIKTLQDYCDCEGFDQNQLLLKTKRQDNLNYNPSTFQEAPLIDFFNTTEQESTNTPLTYTPFKQQEESHNQAAIFGYEIPLDCLNTVNNMFTNNIYPNNNHQPPKKYQNDYSNKTGVQLEPQQSFKSENTNFQNHKTNNTYFQNDQNMYYNTPRFPPNYIQQTNSNFLQNTRETCNFSLFNPNTLSNIYNSSQQNNINNYNLHEINQLSRHPNNPFSQNDLHSRSSETSNNLLLIDQFKQVISNNSFQDTNIYTNKNSSTNLNNNNSIFI